MRRQRCNRAPTQRPASIRLSPSAPHAPAESVPPSVDGLPAARGGWRRAAGRLSDALLLVWCVLAVGVLVLRHLVLPAVGELRVPIAELLGERLGVAVAIERIEGGWAGWRPRLRLAGVSLSDAQGRPALTLPEIDATLAWSSLAMLEPHFHRLEIRAPDLLVRRDPEGALHVAGIALAHGDEGGDGGLGWLLAQRQILIHGARLAWADEARGAPVLELEEVEFRLDRRTRPARFALEARLPAALGERASLRGELRRIDPLRPQRFAGRLYVELGRTALGNWRPWVDLPFGLEGEGALQAWLDADGRGGHALTADLALDGVRAVLGEDLPVLELARLDGRVELARGEDGFRFAGRGLGFETAQGLVLPPTDVELGLDPALDGKARDRGTGEEQAGRGPAAAGGRLVADRLELATLVALAAHLPLDAGLRSRLAALAPRGRVEGLRLAWKGEPAAPEHWALTASFAGLGLAAQDGLPGVTGLSGSVDGDRQRGRFRLAAADMRIDLPAVFDPGPLDFSRLQAQGGWQRAEGRLAIVLDEAAFENADAAGTAAGRYWPATTGAGEIDLQARLTRAESTAVWRYVPRAVNDDTRDWLRRGIRSAKVPEARLELRGALDDFPFRAGQGRFLVSVQVADAALDYAPGWPGIEGIDGEVRFEGPGLRILVPRGRIFGVDLVDVVAEVPDLDQLPSEIMTITGRARGPTAEFLRFVSASPVSRRIDGFTDGMVAEGRGELELELVMPLRATIDSRVQGEYRFADNRIALLEALPPLEAARGRLRFTADTLSIPEAQARLFGNPLRLSAQTGEDGTVRFRAAGRADAAALAAAWEVPLLDELAGTAEWSADIRVGRRGTRVEIASDLAGFACSLPPPFGKSAAEGWPARLAFERPAGSQDARITLAIDDRLRAELLRSAGGVVRGGVALGRASADAPPGSEAGVRVAAVLDRLDLDAWRAVLERAAPLPAAGAEEAAVAGDGAPAAVAEFALAADEVGVFGQTFKAVDLRARADPGGWKARLESDRADGEFDWRAAGKGTLAARFRHLRLVREAGGAQAGADGDSAGDEAVDDPPQRLPALDVVAERFDINELELGRLEVLARNRGNLWQLDRFALMNADGRLAGKGQWRAGARQRTELDFALETASMGGLIRRLGHPDVVRGGAASLAGQLAWRGAPTRIDYPSLSGRLRLETGAGQFNRLEPGVGRLLGILSLQSLPRRITLDFRDVFSEGFAFDRISGSIELARGVLRSEDLEIRGPAARVAMSGSADVVSETQDLRVLVQPTLSESVAIGAAAGLVNPVAGVVTYLAQKVLSDPIEKLFAFEYTVTGAWSDPQVAKRGRAAAPESR
ncbi:MAG TPA: YhdP family protein [Thauera aminoaromatica]|jgi:uncharacterized protein (TIGR02099 family)|nr:YhdP family protein [Thauera aminoaromatica]